jgi:hypothetical protein
VVQLGLLLSIIKLNNFKEFNLKGSLLEEEKLMEQVLFKLSNSKITLKKYIKEVKVVLLQIKLKETI